MRGHKERPRLEGGTGDATGKSVGIDYRRLQCCTCDRNQAEGLLLDVVALALDGDPDASRWIGAAVDHWLLRVGREMAR